VLILVAALNLAVSSVPLSAETQPAGKIPRVGILRSGSPPDLLVEAFRQELRELGYTEGQTVSLEYRWPEGRDERLAALARDLVRLGVDVIVASGSRAQLAKDASTTIPIVMPASNDPVGRGLVASLARPGGNVTGLALLSEQLPGKWMELLKEALPRVARVGVLWHPATVVDQLEVSEAAARSLGLRLHPLKVQRSDDLRTAFAAAKGHHAEAITVSVSPFFYAHRTLLVELAARHRLPAMYLQREFVVEAGGLMSYGPNLRDMFRRAATYVDKILKGARPADLPIEQLTRFELLINLKTAKTLGLTLPPTLLARADEVIQ
jgi:ABC-type uncharacterized transport system substrate-binding protein